MFDGEAGAALVLEQDDVGGQAHRGTVEEDDGHPVIHLALEELVVVPRTGDQQPVDAPLDETIDDLALTRGLSSELTVISRWPSAKRGVLDDPGDGREERVGDVGDDEADRG